MTALALLYSILLAASGDIDRKVETARAALDGGDASRAVELLTAIDEPTAESLFVLGLAYQKRLDEVGLLSKRGVARRLRKALHQALGHDPDHLGARAELADFYHYAPGIVGGSPGKRDEQIEELARRSPAAAGLVRARHAYDDGEYREAERHLTAGIDHDASSAEAWFLRGRARQQLLEKDAEALSDFRRARELGLDDDRIYYYIGRLCVRLGIEPELAERSLLEFIERSDPRNRAVGHYRLATLREQQGRLEEARAEALVALELRPGFEEAEAVRNRVVRKLGE